MSDELAGLDWAVELVKYELVHAPEQSDWPWEDHCEGVAGRVVAAIAEPLRQSQRVEEKDEVIGQLAPIAPLYDDALKRIEELEARLDLQRSSLQERTKRIEELEEERKEWVGTNLAPQLGLLERIEELEAAIREHDCAPVRMASDGQPMISVAGDEKKLKALLDPEAKP